MADRFRESRQPEPVERVDGYDVVFGQVYRRGAVIPEEGDPPERPFEPARELSGRPGTGAPRPPGARGESPSMRALPRAAASGPERPGAGKLLGRAIG